jgi:hypothetical protein
MHKQGFLIIGAKPKNCYLLLKAHNFKSFGSLDYCMSQKKLQHI